MNVLHYLALDSEAFVILLQDTHCTDAETSKLSTSWFFFKQEAWPCHICPLATKAHAFGPRFWLRDIIGYKIVNVYKPPPTQLRFLDLPVLPHPCFYTGDFNCRHADWVYDDNSPDLTRASMNCLALLYNAKDAASFYSGRWNTGTNLDLAFASVGSNSRLPDRRIREKFPRSQH